MVNESILSFRKFCMQSTILPADLHIKLSDIAKGFGMSYYKLFTTKKYNLTIFPINFSQSN
jgi:hypothetical protein